MCTPASSMASTWGSTRAQSTKRPPSENESGVTLTIPIHSGIWCPSAMECSSIVRPSPPGTVSRGASAARGASTKLRCVRSRWGMVRRSVAIRSRPQSRMSTSMGRGDQWDVLTRPNALWISSIHNRSCSGEHPAVHSRTRFRKGRFQSEGAESGSRAGDSTTGETRTMPSPLASRASIARDRWSRRSPRFEPSPR